MAHRIVINIPEYSGLLMKMRFNGQGIKQETEREVERNWDSQNVMFLSFVERCDAAVSVFKLYDGLLQKDIKMLDDIMGNRIMMDRLLSGRH